MNIGSRIKEARELNGMTQEELAQKMGYKSKSTINKIELGINDVSQSNIKKFSEILNVSIPYIMGIDVDYDVTVKVKDDMFSFVVEMNKLNLKRDQLDNLLSYAKFLKSNNGE